MNEEEARDYIRLMQLDIERIEQESSEANRAAMLRLEGVMADKFRQLREERLWSQSDLSKHLRAWGFDMHQTTIAKLESGKRPMRVAEMFALSHVFRLPVGAVFFMARAGGEDVGYDSLTDRLAIVNESIETMKELFLDNMERTIDTLADHQYERLQLVDAMHRVARDRGDEVRRDRTEDDDGEHPAAS